MKFNMDKGIYLSKKYENSYTEFYNKYYNMMRNYAMVGLEGDSYKADDVVQNCMFSLYRKDNFKLIIGVSEDRRRKYIEVMVRNSIASLHRKDKKYVLIGEIRHHIESLKGYSGCFYEECKRLDPLPNTITRLESKSIIRMLDILSKKEKIVFNYILEGLKISEIAETCNLTVSGIKKRITRARVKLKQERFAWQGRNW
ncbi:MAG: RNA polymerase sigma factor [Lachnospiraceae bacterium]|nr:RNA polymerase sigma factor [Lachnospiraceae bacterium]